MKFPALSRLREKFKKAADNTAPKKEQKNDKRAPKNKRRVIETFGIAASLAMAGLGVGEMVTHLPASNDEAATCQADLDSGKPCTFKQTTALVKQEQDKGDFQHGTYLLLLANACMILMANISEKRSLQESTQRPIDAQDALIKNQDRIIAGLEKRPGPPKPPAV